MTRVEELKHKVLDGGQISREEALELYDAPLEELCGAADAIRKKFCSDSFDLCTIINGKSGRCTENCRYCAQSAHYCTQVQEYPLLSSQEITEHAKDNDARGVLRYSIVASGRAMSDGEVEQVCQSVRQIRNETGMKVCVSLGLLNEEQFKRLRQAGVSRVHNNLETSRKNFPNVCTTHTYDDKIASIRAAQRAGLEVCSGGIVGMGETVEDRIDLALTVRELGVRSVPVNLLNPIPGTPFGQIDPLPGKELRRIVAVYRFLIPDGAIRLAGGRGLLEDGGEACFCSGANAAITGDMLTTAGITIESDCRMLERLKYKRRWIGQ